MPGTMKNTEVGKALSISYRCLLSNREMANLKCNTKLNVFCHKKMKKQCALRTEKRKN